MPLKTVETGEEGRLLKKSPLFPRTPFSRPKRLPLLLSDSLASRSASRTHASRGTRKMIRGGIRRMVPPAMLPGDVRGQRRLAASRCHTGIRKNVFGGMRGSARGRRGPFFAKRSPSPPRKNPPLPYSTPSARRAQRAAEAMRASLRAMSALSGERVRMTRRIRRPSGDSARPTS